MEQFGAAFSIQNLMNVAQESIHGMMDNSNQLHHLAAELNLLLSHINLQPNTKVVSVGDEEFIAIFENVVDTWEKFEGFFGPDFLERSQDFVQKLEEELVNLRSNIRNHHRAAAYYQEALDIVTDIFNASQLETIPILNNILEEHASDIKKILVEMEKARNIFPNEEEENEENDGTATLEESRPSICNILCNIFCFSS